MNVLVCMYVYSLHLCNASINVTISTRKVSGYVVPFAYDIDEAHT